MKTDEEYVRAAIDLAREAVANGNTPFGSVLVVGDAVVGRARNTTVTEGDVTAHPELKLARWAARELDPDERADCTMYTSTEPCEMCAAAIHYAGLDRVPWHERDHGVVDVAGVLLVGVPVPDDRRIGGRIAVLAGDPVGRRRSHDEGVRTGVRRPVTAAGEGWRTGRFERVEAAPAPTTSRAAPGGARSIDSREEASVTSRHYPPARPAEAPRWLQRTVQPLV